MPLKYSASLARVLSLSRSSSRYLGSSSGVIFVLRILLPLFSPRLIMWHSPFVCPHASQNLQKMFSALTYSSCINHSSRQPSFVVRIVVQPCDYSVFRDGHRYWEFSNWNAPVPHHLILPFILLVYSPCGILSHVAALVFQGCCLDLCPCL